MKEARALLRGVVAVVLTAVLMAALTGTASAALKAGDILALDLDAAGGTGAIIKVDRATGQLSYLSSNAISTEFDLFEYPRDFVLRRGGDLIVADRQGFGGTGGLIRVDPDTGEQRTVSSNGFPGPDLFAGPQGIEVEGSGSILAVNINGGADMNGSIIRVIPAAGLQSLLSSNAPPGVNTYSLPRAITIERSGAAAVADGNAGNGTIFRVDPVTGAETVLSGNSVSDLLATPQAIDVASNRELIVSDTSAVADGAIVRINPATGQQSFISNNLISGPDLFNDVRGTDFDLNGDVLLADARGGPDGKGAIIRVNPFTGQQSYVSNNVISGPDLFELAKGVIVVPPRCFGPFATIVGTPGANTILGTPFADVIVGLGGNDVIRGFKGNDRICGGRGKDRLIGAAGRDQLRGDAGPDVLKGGKARDILRGGRGRDRLFGGKGRDRLFGGPGRDNQRQ